MKKIIFFLAMAVMVLFATNSYAQTKPEDTDHDGYYNISTLDELRWVSENDSSWSWNFELDCDIDASKTRWWNWGKGWSPIGNEEKPFTGNFDGKNHVITGLTIKQLLTKEERYYQVQQENIAMFGVVKGVHSELKNIILKDIDITVSDKCAAFVYNLENSKVINCHISGTIESIYHACGFIGFINSSILENNSSHCEVIGANCTGFSKSVIDSKLTQCGSHGSFLFNLNVSPFIEKVEQSTIIQCSANSILEYQGNLYTECLIPPSSFNGFISSSHKSEIINSFSTLMYCNPDGLNDASHYGFIQINGGKLKNCYYIGQGYFNEKSNNFIFKDNAKPGSVENVFWNIHTIKDKSIWFKNKKSYLSKGSSIYDLRNKQTYIDAGWDFENIWDIDPNKNEGYPFLRNVPLFDEE